MPCVFASDGAITENCPVGPISGLSSLKTPPPTTKQQARTKIDPSAPSQKQPSCAVLPFLSMQFGSMPFPIKYVIVSTCPLSGANTRGERQVNRDTIAKLADARMGKAIHNNPLRRYRTLKKASSYPLWRDRRGTCFTQPLARTTTDATWYRETLNSIPANHPSP